VPPELELRLASDRDLGFLSALAGDPSVEPFLAPGAGDEDRLRTLLVETVSEGDPSGLFVIGSVGGESVGAVALRLVSQNSRICELTRLMVSPQVRGRGIASTAVRLACRHALVEHDFHRVQAETYGDNLAGQRLFERVGFAREGVRRRAYWRRDQWIDGVLYGLLVDDLRGQT
jgi:RimJ/RimL family protein N-acetyltransferase